VWGSRLFFFDFFDFVNFRFEIVPVVRKAVIHFIGYIFSFFSGVGFDVNGTLEVNSKGFHGGESLEFCGGLVKKKLALVLCLIDLLGKPSALLKNAWAENRLAAADEEGSECVQEFHGRSVLVFC
jgi:hypothetical protein